MSKNRHNKGMWEYLESVGVLEKGTDEEIKAAKRTYRKKYLLAFKQKQRAFKPEFIVNFSKENGEYERITRAASLHKTSVSGFVHLAALAYISQAYIVPDRMQVARLEQLLRECLNEIKTLVKAKEHFFWDREQKLSSIEKHIEKLEVQIGEVFRNPPLLSHDRQNKVA